MARSSDTSSTLGHMDFLEPVHILEFFVCFFSNSVLSLDRSCARDIENRAGGAQLISETVSVLSAQGFKMDLLSQTVAG